MMMRGLGWALLLGILLPTVGQVQNLEDKRTAAAPPCVDVSIGGEQSYGCLNQRLARAIPVRRFTSNSDSPALANVAPQQAGTFNQAAISEQLGSSLGRTTKPQRPPPVTYPAGLAPR
jgi:hypothetical protein